MDYSVLTFGCRVNQADSLRVEQALAARGACAVAPERADLVIVNSCSVTAAADQGVRQAVRRVVRLNPRARIVVTGCYATRQPAEVSSLPNVLRVVPNDRKDSLVEGVVSDGGLPTAASFGEDENPCGAALEPGVAGRTVFTLCAQTGCGEQCAYCVIPVTRGRPRSAPIQRLVDDVARAARAGFREIVLAGVHLGSYGRDLSPESSLESLLRALAALPCSVRFRIGALEPMDCGAPVVDLVAGGSRFAPHFHLPLQHASDRMLRLMRRPYSLDRYRRLVDGIRERLPHAAIGSDLIVGFPGETDKDFEASVRYLSDSPLTYLHVFPYSDRPGTAASRMAGRPPGAVVRARARRLQEIGARLAARFRRAQVGTVRPGLTLEDGTLVMTDNYLKVRIPSGLPRNEEVHVRVDHVDAVVRGHVVDRASDLPQSDAVGARRDAWATSPSRAMDA
jgi:threonylcarbamoyladenosine tRNA methylthiotransferase MtaB